MYPANVCSVDLHRMQLNNRVGGLPVTRGILRKYRVPNSTKGIAK
jgi:hypothetical protein